LRRFAAGRFAGDVFGGAPFSFSAFSSRGGARLGTTYRNVGRGFCFSRASASASFSFSFARTSSSSATRALFATESLGFAPSACRYRAGTAARFAWGARARADSTPSRPLKLLYLREGGGGQRRGCEATTFEV
jgi:hypothetical protein